MACLLCKVEGRGLPVLACLLWTAGGVKALRGAQQPRFLASQLTVAPCFVVCHFPGKCQIEKNRGCQHLRFLWWP